MKPIHILRHVDIEGPAYLEQFLERHGIPWQLVKIDEGEPVPASIEPMGALVLMGGPMSVNDELPWISQELALIRQAADSGLPVLGHCLGAQLISKALGGEVGPNDVKEIGWFEVERLEPSPYPSLPPYFPAFHWHGETFTLPPGASPMFRSEYCPRQGFVLGPILALQFHLEILPDMIPSWCERYRQELEENSTAPSVQSREEMQRRASHTMPLLTAVADIIYEKWLELETT